MIPLSIIHLKYRRRTQETGSAWFVSDTSGIDFRKTKCTELRGLVVRSPKLPFPLVYDFIMLHITLAASMQIFAGCTCVIFLVGSLKTSRFCPVPSLM